jgi:hypothetical protein
MNTTGQRRRRWRLALLALVVAGVWGWWAVRPDRPLTAWEAPCDPVVRVELSADGTRVLAVGNTGAVDNVSADSYRLWDAATGCELAAVFDRTGIDQCHFSPDGRWVMIRLLDGTTTVRAAADGREQPGNFRLPPEAAVGPDRPADSAVSPDGRLLAAMEGPGTTAWAVWVERLLRRPLPGRRLRAYVRLTDRHTGADLGRVPALPQGLGFDPDSRSVWSHDQTADPASGAVWLHVRQTRVPPPGPPAWLVGLTVLAVLLAVADGWRSRRRVGLSAAAVGGYPAGQGGPPP